MCSSQRLREVWQDLTGSGTLAKAKEVSQFHRHGEDAYLPTPSSCLDCCVWSCRGSWEWDRGPPFQPPVGFLHSPKTSSGLPSSKKPSLAAPTRTAACQAHSFSARLSSGKCGGPQTGWSSLRVGASSSSWAPAWSCRCSANACPCVGSGVGSWLELYFPKRFTEQGSGRFSHSLLNLHQPCSSVVLFLIEV